MRLQNDLVHWSQKDLGIVSYSLMATNFYTRLII